MPLIDTDVDVLVVQRLEQSVDQVSVDLLLGHVLRDRLEALPTAVSLTDTHMKQQILAVVGGQEFAPRAGRDADLCRLGTDVECLSMGRPNCYLEGLPRLVHDKVQRRDVGWNGDVGIVRIDTRQTILCGRFGLRRLRVGRTGADGDCDGYQYDAGQSVHAEGSATFEE